MYHDLNKMLSSNDVKIYVSILLPYLGIITDSKPSLNTVNTICSHDPSVTRVQQNILEQNRLCLFSSQVVLSVFAVVKFYCIEN